MNFHKKKLFEFRIYNLSHEKHFFVFFCLFWNLNIVFITRLKTNSPRFVKFSTNLKLELKYWINFHISHKNFLYLSFAMLIGVLIYNSFSNSAILFMGCLFEMKKILSCCLKMLHNHSLSTHIVDHWRSKMQKF